jgi:hypothetical protein
MSGVSYRLGRFGDRRLDACAADLHRSMVERGGVVLARLGGGRAGEVRFGRWLGNGRVTVEAIVEGWGEGAAAACAGRHVLAIQDTTELAFRDPGQRACLGPVGKGKARGLLAHVVLAADADTGACLGPVAGRVWSRPDPAAGLAASGAPAGRESARWLEGARDAARALARAAAVTVVADREGDVYEDLAWAAAGGAHLLVRACQDRRLDDGGRLFEAAGAWAEGRERRRVEVPVGPKAMRRRRAAEVEVRFGAVAVRRPKNLDGEAARALPAAVELRLVEVREVGAPPAGERPLAWRLLTTHAVADEAAAWRVVDWYRRRWLVEQLFRAMQARGLRVEESQVASAEGLRRLVAVAVRAAATVMMLVQARDGAAALPASAAFEPAEEAALGALGSTLEGRTARQRNPHPPGSLAWAGWIVARLGGWDGYASSRKPGPVTFAEGLVRFRAVALGFALRDVCIP